VGAAYYESGRAGPDACAFGIEDGGLVDVAGANKTGKGIKSDIRSIVFGLVVVVEFINGIPLVNVG
jgi:hypothetical protein